MSGFTGPKFGLELMFDLEKDQYMPTSREAGIKIVVHDKELKADPDQDAINISPGVVTYIGVQLQKVTRLPAPYHDKCINEWPEGEYKRWAYALKHETYTIQVCLKICLQMYTLEMCKCWAPSAPWPPFVDKPQCLTSRTSRKEDCMDLVRHHYYEEEIECNCPPRCEDRIYERSISTGQETRQCSAIQSDDQMNKVNGSSAAKESDGSSADDKDNTAKVIVYFHSLSFNEIKQEKKYTIEGLLGAIGGILGVYLGVSFFAIFEVVDVLVRGCSKNNATGSGGSRRRLSTPSTVSPVQRPQQRYPERVVEPVKTRRRKTRPFPEPLYFTHE